MLIWRPPHSLIAHWDIATTYVVLIWRTRAPLVDCCVDSDRAWGHFGGVKGFFGSRGYGMGEGGEE